MDRSWAQYVAILALTGALVGSLPSQDAGLAGKAAIRARRAQILLIAERYRSHAWKAGKEHSFHGIDERGTRVDTPDAAYRKGGFQIDGSENIGIPYKWGGFTSIEEFDRGLERGLYVGHLPKRGSSGSSSQALGVDCSGFVSRCWGLPKKQSTRSLGHLCYRLDRYADLLPGDVINLFDKHVMLFKGFIGDGKSQVRVVESAGVGVRERVLPVARLKKAGFLPLRYRPLDPRWVVIDFGDASFRVSERDSSTLPDVKDAASDSWHAGRWEPAKSPKKAANLEMFKGLLLKAKPGQWARYRSSRVAEKGSHPSLSFQSSISRAVASVQGGMVEIQELTRIGDETMATSAEHDANSKSVHWLVAFPAIDLAFRDMKITKSETNPGQYKIGGRRFHAHRVTVRIEGDLLIRSIRYPVSIDLQGFLSKDVPLYGFLAARYDMVASFGKNAKGEARELRMSLAYRLADYSTARSK